MAIRTCVKAMMEHNGKYLVEKYEYPKEVFYEFPGGV